jgi:hypothetical protein
LGDFPHVFGSEYWGGEMEGLGCPIWMKDLPIERVFGAGCSWRQFGRFWALLSHFDTAPAFIPRMTKKRQTHLA